MTIRPDRWIRQMALEEGLIEPFEPSQVSRNVISYGISSYGYDVRLAADFLVPPDSEEVLDPKAAAWQAFAEEKADSLELAPGRFCLGRTVEYLRIPRDVLTLCVGKSSYARCGVLVNVTPFEPEWEGYATLCIANLGGRPVRLHAGEGIAQVLFFQSDEACDTSYADRQGRYQAQQGITPAQLG